MRYLCFSNLPQILAYTVYSISTPRYEASPEIPYQSVQLQQSLSELIQRLTTAGYTVYSVKLCNRKMGLGRGGLAARQHVGPLAPCKYITVVLAPNIPMEVRLPSRSALPWIGLTQPVNPSGYDFYYAAETLLKDA